MDQVLNDLASWRLDRAVARNNEEKAEEANTELIE
jgi:hypothetical protein